MKKIKLVFLSVLSLVALGALAVGTNIIGLKADSEPCSHAGYHYDATTATDFAAGNAEFWACCKCHEVFLEEPTDGSFETRGLDKSIGFNSSHVAYVAPTMDKWDGSSTEAFTHGAGTQADPYLIENAANLKFLSAKLNAADVNYQSAYYKMTTGIDLDSKVFPRLGNSKVAFFSGNFDGNGHNIINFKATGFVCYSGLFGYLMDADVKNLNVDVDITAGTNSFMDGGIAGVMYMSTIENCTVTGSITGYQNSVGGIVGKVINVNSNVASKHTTSIVKDCVNKASVTLSTPNASNNGTIGGIVGYIPSTSLEITGCTNEGAITSGTCTGGVLGRADEAATTVITNCINKGTVSGTDFTAGIVGFVRKNANSAVRGCYNYGNVSAGNSKSAGIIGLNRGTVSNCYCARNVLMNGTLVSESRLYDTGSATMPGAAICYQTDVANGGSISNCFLCDPLA